MGFAVVASVLAFGMQLVTIWYMSPPQFNDGVAYPSRAAEYAAYYAGAAAFFTKAGSVHLVPSVVAVVLGAIGVQRSRPVVAAVSLGLGAVNVVLAILGFVLIPVIADTVATWVVGQ